MKFINKKYLILALIGFTFLFSGNVLALPATDVTANYTDYPKVQGTLKGLTTKTVTNVYNGSGREHDNTRDAQTQLITKTNDTFFPPVLHVMPQTSGPHGNFTDNTNACGRCHALHTAKSGRLIRFDTMPTGTTAQNTIYGTCTYCHNFNGQSTYDVKDGMIWDTFDGKRYATLGGGFERMLVVEGEPEVATVVKASSTHMVNLSTGTKFKAPGGYRGGNTSVHIELTCTACHNPHGSPNSRILKEKITVGTVGGAPDVKATTQAEFQINLTNPFGDESSIFNREITNFCSTCHSDYNSTGAKNKSGNFSAAYRHKMGMDPADGLNDGYKGFGYNPDRFILPTAKFPDPSGNGSVECITCHYAHGTFVRVNNIKTYDNTYVSSADNSIDLQNLPGYTGVEPPKNLRMDNRGVCQNCHQWPDANQTKPILTDVLDPDQDGTVLYGDTGTLKSGTSVISPNSNTIVIRFNQYVIKKTGLSAENISNYTLTNTTDSVNVPLASAAVQPDGRTIVIRPTAALAGGKSYQLQVQNITDTNGVQMATATVSFNKP